MAKVLIIDDEENDRFLLGLALDKMGHSYGELPHGRLAVETLAAEQYDAVILDLIMPETEGAETLQAIHQNFPELPVIVMSGLGKDYLPMMSHLGAYAIAEKSADFNAVLSALQSAFDEHRINV